MYGSTDSPSDAFGPSRGCRTVEGRDLPLFPNKATIFRALAQQTFEQQADRITAQLAAPDDTDPRTRLTDGRYDYLDRHRTEPFRVQLRAAVHADPELSELDLADSRRNAATTGADATGGEASRPRSSRRQSDLPGGDRLPEQLRTGLDVE